MSKQITQEPWVYGPASNYEGFYIAPASCLPTLAAVQVGCRLNDGSRSHVNTITCFNFPGQTEDIARLIAAAPSMLKALEDVLSFEDPDSLEDQQTDIHLRQSRSEAWERAKAAIAKATGAQP